MRNSPLRPDDLLELFEIDSTATAAPEAVRREPVLPAARFPAGFDDPGPPGTRRSDPSRLDTGRATAEPDRAPPVPRRRALPLGLIGSLGLHLSPLLVLLHWSSAPAEIAAPIPVQLVLEEPPPAPPPAPAAKPPPGRRASEDIGETTAEPDKSAETQIAAALPRPAPERAAVQQEPKPTTHAELPVKEAVVARLAPNPRPAPHAQVPGPGATRDEYLAYCMTLIRRHFGLLPPSFIAGRHGATILSIVVLDDGTIARIAVARGSAYPDIDARIEEAVAAVRRFPPLPQWIQGPSVSLTLQLGYPGGL
jgi:TonB family protein